MAGESGQKVAFVHGGPGLNCAAEKEILAKGLEEFGFNPSYYNQPSLFREGREYIDFDHAFKQMVSTLEDFLKQSQPELIVSHCYGMWPLLYALDSLEEYELPIILLAPAVDLLQSDLNLLRVVSNDFLGKGDKRHDEVDVCIANASDVFDEWIQQGYKLALEDPDLFQNHFVDHKYIMDYLMHLTDPKWQIDAELMFAVRKTQGECRDIFQKVFSEIHIVYGKHDRVIKYEESLVPDSTLLKAKSVNIFNESGHFPHIEETQKLLKLMQSLLKSKCQF